MKELLSHIEQTTGYEGVQCPIEGKQTIIFPFAGEPLSGFQDISDSLPKGYVATKKQLSKGSWQVIVETEPS